MLIFQRSQKELCLVCQGRISIELPSLVSLELLIEKKTPCQNHNLFLY